MSHRIPSLATVAIVSVLAGLAAVPLSAQTEPPYTVVESGESFGRLQDAINAIGNGSGTIRIAAGRHGDCGVQQGGDIRYVAAVPGQSSLEGVVCEGKGALVLRGRSARVDGMVFAGHAAADANGAGIRLEDGNLAVTQSWFHDSQQGIVSANDTPGGVITVDKSTFTRLGNCDGSGCAHSIYGGRFGSLSVTRCRFEQGTGGHYVKSRTKRVTIESNSFDDTGGRSTNYMIDLPEGAVGRIAGNWFVQGRNKENHSAFITIGAEELRNATDGLTIEGNDARFAPGLSRTSAFVADFSGARITIEGNTLSEGLTRYERRQR